MEEKRTRPTDRQAETQAETHAEQAEEHAQETDALEADELAPTPFDHPMFLPVLFVGLAGWFGFDAYLTSDPDMLEHLDFNRYGFRLLVFLGLLYGYRGVCEMKRTPSHPLAMPGLLLLSTLWLAHDAWLSSDAHNVLRAPVNRELVPWLLALTAWYSFTGWRRMQGAREPAYILPLLILGCAGWFGYNGFLNEAESAAADATLNRWAAGTIFAGFLVSVYYAFQRVRSAGRSPGHGATPPS